MILKRCYYLHDIGDPIVGIYLHGFSDASKVAFGACIYMKAVAKSGNVNMSLVTAKSRVAPIRKNLTIPRLELLGNFILAKLMKVVNKAISEEVNVDGHFCWSDSMVTLAWIKSTKREFKVFVKNRVEKIRENVKPSSWNYCHTTNNPADLITRFNPGNNSEVQLWREGPPQLKYGNSLHNGLDIIKKDDENRMIVAQKFEYDDNDIKVLLNTVELKNEYCKEAIITLNNCELGLLGSDYNGNPMSAIEQNNLFVTTHHKGSYLNKANRIEICCKDISSLIDIEKYSTLRRLMRVTCWILRFVRNVRINKDRTLTKYISTDETRYAHKLWLKVNQRQLLKNENYENIRCALNLVEEDGLIRAHGRIQRANLPDEVRKPIMLERKHKMSELILWDCHHRVKHNGVRQTLVEFQLQYWVTKSKSFVKKILYNCVICR